MINTLYLPELREMLAEKQEAELREFCTALHPARTAEFMEGLTADEMWQVLKFAEPRVREEVFSFFHKDRQAEILVSQERREIAELIAQLAADDRVDLLHGIDPRIVDEILPLLPTEERRDVLRLRSYPEGTAGAVMTTEAAKLSENLTVREAFDELSRQAHRSPPRAGLGAATCLGDRQAADEALRTDDHRPRLGGRPGRPGESRRQGRALRLAGDPRRRSRTPHAGHHHA
jgi:Mg/Co/Ni transporter MgtE